MTKNILSFLIPLVIILALGFVPQIRNSAPINNIEDNINLSSDKIDQIIDSDVSIKNLRMTFYDHRNVLINKLLKKGYTKKQTNHIMNYYFYYNERSIAWLRIMKNEGEFYLNEFFRFNYLMNLESNAEVNKISDNFLDLFKEVLPFNRAVGSYAYGYLMNNKDVIKASKYLDGNESISDKLVF